MSRYDILLGLTPEQDVISEPPGRQAPVGLLGIDSHSFYRPFPYDATAHYGGPQEEPEQRSLYGITGFQGYVGLSGITGIQGETGLYGATGLQGETGIDLYTNLGIGTGGVFTGYGSVDGLIITQGNQSPMPALEISGHALYNNEEIATRQYVNQVVLKYGSCFLGAISILALLLRLSFEVFK